MLRAIPLFVILLIIYNVTMLTGNIDEILATQIFSMGLISGGNWRFTAQDLFVVMGVLVLYIEIFKATRTGAASIMDHSLSVLVFVIFLVEFLTVAACGTSTFFILGLMSMMDVVSGFTVSIVAARRDFGFGNPDIR